MALDRLSPSELLEYHKYRKKLKHLYVCTDCAKGFDRDKPVSKCIFCDGTIKELEKDDIPSAKPMYRYTCSTCDKVFIAEHADTCIECGSKYLHFYETSKISTRELLSMRKKQIKEKIRFIGARSLGHAKGKGEPD